jgi:hypothetical protein
MAERLYLPHREVKVQGTETSNAPLEIPGRPSGDGSRWRIRDRDDPLYVLGSLNIVRNWDTNPEDF